MKTLLYNPIFINPQAYYVFPRLTRYLQPDNESTSEPANYIGTIEVKVIAYGDTTLKRNSIAYNSRNTDGETYIDGILNKNIVCPQLYKITHSITIINQLANKEEVISPTIGSDTTHKIYFSQMSLYDFMLFDDISTDDKIKQLNEYVGTEGNTEWRKTE